MLRHIISEMDEVQNASYIAKSITIFEAIHWLTLAWKTVEASTIQKCFRGCGFAGEEETDEATQEEETDEATQEEEAQFCSEDLQNLNKIAPDSTADNLLQMDRGIATHCQETGDAAKEKEEEEGEEEEDIDDKEPEPRPLKESLASVTALLEDAKGRANMEWLSTAQKLREIIQEEKMKTELKQQKINDFFKPMS